MTLPLPWRVRRAIEALATQAVRVCATRTLPRMLLNAIYLRASPARRSAFHHRHAKLFREAGEDVVAGVWRVDFCGRRLRMPLTGQRFWLDWDLAVSIVGHDIEVKLAYQQLLCGPRRPDLFIDIGANYGTHSLLFLTAGIETMSFEPNAKCGAHFTTLCEFNGVSPELYKLALGASDGEVELHYPERDTWLGSTDPAVAARLGTKYVLTSDIISQRPLDSFLARLAGRRVLIKIDTEGNELAVLQGATRVLAEIRPAIIFECWAGTERERIFECLATHDYGIRHLPCIDFVAEPGLNVAEFIASPANNFIALAR